MKVYEGRQFNLNCRIAITELGSLVVLVRFTPVITELGSLVVLVRFTPVIRFQWPGGGAVQHTPPPPNGRSVRISAPPGSFGLRGGSLEPGCERATFLRPTFFSVGPPRPGNRDLLVFGLWHLENFCGPGPRG